MKRFTITLIISLAFIAVNGQTSILEVISPAGGYYVSTEAGVSVSWTLGEPVVGTLVNEAEGIILTQGFQQGDFVIVNVPVDPAIGFTARVFPNPAKDETTVKITMPTQGRINLMVFDITGRVVLSDQFDMFTQEYSHTLNVSSLRAGIYLIRVNSGTKSSRVLKLIKE
jgi:hypothetical protein